MTKHFSDLEFKDTDETDPVALVTKSLDDLSKSVETKLKDIETKADTTKLVDRMDKLEAKMNRPGAGEHKDPDAALETKAFGAYLRSGDRADPLELKTLIVSSDTQGGYLAPTEMATEFIRDLVQYSPIRGLASVRATASPAVSYPKRIGRTNALWRGETQAQTTGEPTFGQLEIPVREINTYIDISNQLLADSAGAAESEVRMALAEDFGLKEGLAFLKGTGPLQPEGLLVNGDIDIVATGNASTLGSGPADMLIDTFYSLPAAYRNAGTWLMNSTTLAAIRKLKDGTTGTYLWSPGFQGQADTILGRPVIDCPDMDSVGSGTTPIAFGDIKTTYRILDRVGLSILVNPYLLATNGITRIHATRRVGGAVVQPAAMKKIVCKTS